MTTLGWEFERRTMNQATQRQPHEVASPAPGNRFILGLRSRQVGECR